MSTDHTILLVDDDEDFLLQNKIRLEARGYSTISAASMEDAKELLKTTKPDLALIDLMMEHPDAGFTLAYHIKTTYPGTPVVIISAVSAEAGIDFDATTDEEKGWIKADAFLAKPIRPEQLDRELERLLS